MPIGESATLNSQEERRRPAMGHFKYTLNTVVKGGHMDPYATF